MPNAFMSWLFVLLLATTASAVEFGLPIDCEVGRSCVIQNYVDHDPSPNARDYLCGTLTYDGHNGTDFRLPTLVARRAGVNVLAAADGQVLRTRDGMADILMSALNTPSVTGRECGNAVVISNAEGWETQYCHLAQSSLRVKPGDRVVKGQPIGQVGLSGRTEFPHLHLTVRHRGKVVDPFAFGTPEEACGAGTPLWHPSVRKTLAYRARTVLNAGFATRPVTMEDVESGEAGRVPLGPEADALVAFVRAIGLKLGDVQRLSIAGPDGQVIADRTEKPLDRDKAQVLLFGGRKRSPLDWQAGTYRATYQVIRDGQNLFEQRFETSF
jgi:Peptidase family M23